MPEQQRTTIQREIRERTVAYLIAAFSFVAGLAWNEAIKAFIEHLFPFGNNTVLAKVLYAVIVTLVVVLVTVYLMKWSRSEREEEVKTGIKNAGGLL